MCMAEIQTKQSYGNPWLEIWCCQTKRRGKSKDCPLFSWVTNLKIKIRRRDFEFDDTDNESNVRQLLLSKQPLRIDRWQLGALICHCCIWFCEQISVYRPNRVILYSIVVYTSIKKYKVVWRFSDWFHDFAFSPHFFTCLSLFILKFSNLLVRSKEVWRHIYFQFHKSASGWLGEIRFPKLVSPHQWMVKCTQMFFYNLNNFVNESIPLISSNLTSDFSVNSLNNSIIETNRGFKFSTS